MKFPEWTEEQLRKIAEAEGDLPCGLMACSPEILAELIEIAKTDEGTAKLLKDAGINEI